MTSATEPDRPPAESGNIPAQMSENPYGQLNQAESDDLPPYLEAAARALAAILNERDPEGSWTVRARARGH